MDTRGDVTSSVLEDHRNKAMNIFTNEYGLSLVRRLFMVGFFFLNSHEMRDLNADFLSFFYAININEIICLYIVFTDIEYV